MEACLTRSIHSSQLFLTAHFKFNHHQVGEAALAQWHLRNTSSFRGCFVSFVINDKSVDFLQVVTWENTVHTYLTKCCQSFFLNSFLFWSNLFLVGCSWQTRSAGWMLSKVDIIISFKQTSIKLDFKLTTNDQIPEFLHRTSRLESNKHSSGNGQVDTTSAKD